MSCLRPGSARTRRARRRVTRGVNNGGIATINKGTSIIDSGTLACCDPTVSGNLALNLSMPGTWSSGSPRPTAAITSLINMQVNPTRGFTQGQVNSLTDKLKSALASIQAGLTKQAVNQLNAFISSVQTAQTTGKPGAQTATTPINAAAAIIAMLS